MLQLVAHLEAVYRSQQRTGRETGGCRRHTPVGTPGCTWWCSRGHRDGGGMQRESRGSQWSESLQSHSGSLILKKYTGLECVLLTPIDCITVCSSDARAHTHHLYSPTSNCVLRSSRLLIWENDSILQVNLPNSSLGGLSVCGFAQCSAEAVPCGEGQRPQSARGPRPCSLC